MPKLILCSDDFLPKIGGISTCAHEVAKGLSKQGWEIVVLTRSHAESDSFDNQQEYRVIRISPPSDSILAIPYFIKKIRKIARNEQPDFFLHMSWLPTAAAHWLSRCKIPYGVYGHGVELLESNRTFKKSLRKKLTFLKRKILKKANPVFAVSNFTKDLLIRGGAQKENVFVTFNGVDPENLLLSAKNQSDIFENKNIDPNQKVILTVCRLQANKGIDFTIEALNKIKKRNDFIYLVAGDGPDKKQLESKVTSFKLGEQVHFLGSLRHNQLMSLYNRCDLFVMPSRFDKKTPSVEGFGIAYLEAGAFSKPSIGGNSGGVPDAIIDQETGLLVTPTDPLDIAHKIELLLDDEELRINLGSNARRRIDQELNWHKITQKISEHIKGRIK